MDRGTFIGGFNEVKTIKTFDKLLEWMEIAGKFDKQLIVQGGFAVDLAVGKLTRKHDDLDLICLEGDLGWFRERLEVDGYKFKNHEGHNPDISFCAYKYNFMAEDSIYIDLEGINIDSRVWDRSDGEKYVWSIKPDSLYQERDIGGIKVKYLNPKLVYEFKKTQLDKGWQERDKENHDFELLEEVLRPDTQ